MNKNRLLQNTLWDVEEEQWANPLVRRSRLQVESDESYNKKSLSSSRVRDQSKNSRRASSQLPSNRILEKSQSSPTPRTGKSQEAACQLDTQLYKRNGHRLTPPSLDYSLLSSPSAGGIFENRDEHFGQNAHVRSHRSVFPRHILRSFLEHFTLSYRLGFPPDLSHQANSLDW
ncbi:hypothetical protein RIF29_43347 [Crotalaria pallida]|uniref:Uncharacterized protein n=1 Tax=Crotalaria pallida TaxID=3830 RepID=A0AAN9DZU4_CROPI